MQKSDLMAWLEREHQQWHNFFGQIDPALLDQAGVAGDWSIKDVVAHLIDWQQHLNARIKAAHLNQPEPAKPWPADLEGDDAVNAWFYQKHHNRSAQDVLADMDQTYQELHRIVTELPETLRYELVEPDYHLVWIGEERFLPGEFYHHFHDDHEQEVRAWLIP